MKIAILNIFCGQVERGAEIWAQNLAEELGKKYEVDIFQIGQKRGKYYHTRIIKFVPFINSGFFYHLTVLWFTLICLPQLFQSRYDWLIPVNGRFQTLLIYIVRFVVGGRILIVGHAGVGREDKINLILGRPDVFVALSQKAFSWANNITGDKTKIFFIPNGVDINLFKSQGKKADLSLPDPIVICVTELLPYKRVEYLIRAVNKIKKVSLLIIGKGTEENKVDQLASSLLGDRYLRIDHIEHAKIARYYRSCDIFSLPSRESEAFGLVYLEALSSNLPVVAPDDPNRRMLIGNAGVFVNVEDSSNYANAIRLALGKDFKDTPRIRSEKYSWTKISKMYEQILGKI